VAVEFTNRSRLPIFGERRELFLEIDTLHFTCRQMSSFQS
jgi:hypothetical protein